ncbi:translocation/assembly module TamB domain-containing protein [Psychromonas sp. KJ10-10]|uniref:translocation/assembly module TamB domain-containing protein n=1 Tax=Psychromonas sp. KJ10-10 TaxID=3391823 RepID=UPI0039B3CCCE
MPHSVSLDWKNLAWPLTGEAQYTSKQGSFTSKGALNDQTIKLQTEYEIETLPSGTVSLSTQGDLQHLNVESLKVNTLDGEIDFSGLLTWKDKIDWLGQLKITDIDLKTLETAYDGHFSGLINQQVEVVLYENSKPDWQFDFPTLQVNGELLARPLTLSGRVSGNNQQGINFDNLNLNNADNSFVINGLFAEQNNLDIDLNITDLSHAVLQVAGQIKGKINIKGPMDELDISSELSAQELSYESYQVEKLALQSTALITDKPSLSLNLDATNIKVNDQLIDDIDVQVTNAKTATDNIKHTIDLLLNSELVSTDLTLDVTQTDKELLTEFNQAVFYLPEQDLSLLKPFSVTQNGNNINLTAHCWQVQASPDGKSAKQNAGDFCIHKFNVGETGDIVFDIDKYLLTNVNPFLPEQLRLAGALSASAKIGWEKQQKPNFTANIASEDLLLIIKSDLETKTVNEYPLQAFNLNVAGEDKNITLDADIFSERLVNIKVDADVTPYENSPQIDSTIDINFPDFELFLPLIPQLEMLKGQLNSQLKVAGNLKKPLVNGEVKIENALISAPSLPMKIYELQSVVNIDDTKASLDGSFNTSSTNNTVGEKVANIPLLTNTLNILDKSVKKIGSQIIPQNEPKASALNDAIPGLALIKGEFDWSDKPTGNVVLSGHKLEVYDYGKIDLFLSPDISVTMNENIIVKGNLDIDRGKLVIKEVPAGAVSESKDIIIVDVEKEKVVPSLPMVIDLNLDMGDEFQLVALGLDTFINGNLIVKQELKKDLTINGELSFVDGSYRSLGQQLVLQDSRVVFQGAPDSPYLSIEAIRDPDNVEDDVTAGVRVTGTPDELELVIFSDPAMAQQQALSYLTRGKALDSSSESSSMANMLIDIVAGQSDGLMSSIGEGIGIKDLSLSSSGSGDEQSVGVRGEVAPGIELSYGVGVFDSFSIFAIRYKLFEKFYIEASSGIDQAVDAYYEWDWD